MKIAALLVAALALPCSAQRLHVYSPLTRVGPDGTVVKPDKGAAEPRHILSPGIPRNGYSSFRIVVELEKPEAYTLDVAQNPEDAVKPVLYKETFVETALGYIPDSLQRVSIPYRGFVTDFRLPGQRVVTFWLDVWPDRNAPVDRIKVQPQLFVDSIDDWVIYPMEVRVQYPVVPDMKATYTSALPPLTDPADAVVRGPLRAAACGAAPPRVGGEPKQLTARDLLHRNVLQHMVMFRDREKLKPMIEKFTGMPPEKWCKTPATPPSGPEWYLRMRDRIFAELGARD